MDERERLTRAAFRLAEHCKRGDAVSFCRARELRHAMRDLYRVAADDDPMRPLFAHAADVLEQAFGVQVFQTVVA